MSLLRGFRILAVEQYGAAPFGAVARGAGAEVIKVEQAAQGGDVSRLVGPHFLADLPDGAQSLFFQSLNQGKKSITLNLVHPEGGPCSASWRPRRTAWSTTCAATSRASSA